MAIDRIVPRFALLVAAALALALAPGPASAETSDLIGPQSLSVIGDIRLVAADGERSWTDAGFGKSRFGGDAERDWKLRPVATEAELVWQPRFSWSLSG